MGLNLEGLNEKVNGTDNDNDDGNNGTPAAPVATAEPTADYFRGQIAEANARIAALESEKLEAAEAFASERLRNIAATVKKPYEKLGSGAADLAVQRAIKACGGLALYNQLSPEAKLKMEGVENSTAVKDSDLKRCFGKDSNAQDAQRLAKSDPAAYSRMRKIARARGIL